MKLSIVSFVSCLLPFRPGENRCCRASVCVFRTAVLIYDRIRNDVHAFYILCKASERKHQNNTNFAIIMRTLYASFLHSSLKYNSKRKNSDINRKRKALNFYFTFLISSNRARPGKGVSESDSNGKFPPQQQKKSPQ